LGREFQGLDAYAEVHVLLVAGVGIKVVRCATVELIALTEFSSDEEAESDGSEAGGDPAYGFEEGGLLLFFIVVVVFRASGVDRGFLRCCAVVSGCGAGTHALDDSLRVLALDKTIAV
jgi:hypothetical protein